MKTKSTYVGLEIAIIGMSGQFPMSPDCAAYWNNLMAGKELTTHYSDDELLKRGVRPEELNDSLFVKSSAVLDGKEYFDHQFFDYRPEEAALMDPQIRHFHAHCWKALEDAAYASSVGTQKIGLFATASDNDNWKLYTHFKAKDFSVDPYYLNFISNKKFISSLVAYKLNLKGPVVYVDSACSSSLVAIHLACRSLLTRECNIALSGGVKIGATIRKGYYYQEGMIQSPDGRCRTFDSEANGTFSGEGVGVVVLKRLADAIKDKDNIYAVVRSSGINNDGDDKVGFTAPSVKGQSECIRMVHKLGGIDPHSIGYLEAHGTATKLGDPIEIAALKKAFQTETAGKYCAIGSVKSNMGHLDTAAGVAGLIKAALSLKNRKIVPSLHFKQPNPEIDFEGGPFYVSTELKDWLPIGGQPLRAGVSSFGIGGTNAHVVLEEAPVCHRDPAEKSLPLLTMSAKNKTALGRQVETLRAFVLSDPTIDINDMAFTFQVGRKHFNHRLAIGFRDREDLVAKLSRAESKNRVVSNVEVKLVFMFQGIGSQYVNMGRDLYETEPLFRQEMDNGFRILEARNGKNYKEIVYPSGAATDDIDNAIFAQPILFVFEYALAKLLMSWGIKPQFMIGHSLGEYVAACLQGVLNFKDALRLVARRVELAGSTEKGGMISIALNEKEARRYLNEKISIAAINGPQQVVLSGPAISIDELGAQLEMDGIPGIRVNSSVAFHSGVLDPILDEFETEFDGISFGEHTDSGCPLVCCLTGEFAEPDELKTANYWKKHLRQAVNFSAGITGLLSSIKAAVFIEIGAGRPLIGLLKQHGAGKVDPIGVNLIRRKNEEINDREFLHEAIGQLWTYGTQIDWDVFYGPQFRKRISLPTYSFEPNKFAAEVSPIVAGQMKAIHPDSKELKDWIYYPIWKNSFLFTGPGTSEKRTYLFFSKGCEFSSLLIDELSRDGQRVIGVLCGSKFERSGPNQFFVDPTEPGHFNELFKELKTSGVEADDIIYSWSLGMDGEKIGLTMGNEALGLSYLYITNIIRGVIKNSFSVKNGVTILTDSIHQVMGFERGYVQSLALGVLSSLHQEYPMFCRNVDVILGEDSKETAKLVFEEINSGKFEQRIVAVRNRRRWVKDYQRNESPAVLEKESLVKQGGVYLITGGLGNVGFLFAKHLVSRYNAKVVLIGKRGVSDLTESDDGRRRLKNLEWLGEHARYIKVDISNVEELRQLAIETEAALGKIDGVIHAAGDLSRKRFELIEDTTPQNVFSSFAPKVAGVINLYEVFKDRGLDFVWITSSLASIVGGLRFAAYSAANAFMEHFVSSKSRELPNWFCAGLSEIDVNEAGGAEQSGSKKRHLKGEALLALFELTLRSNRSPVFYETIQDLHVRLEETFSGNRGEADVKPFNVEKAERPGLPTAFVAPGTKTEKMLVELLENFMGIQQLGVEDNFFDLGGDSLKAMSFLVRIKNTFHVHLTIKAFFSNPTIGELASKIDESILLTEKKPRSSKLII